MSTTVIKPWVESVTLHPDLVSPNFSEDIFALDLGPLADGNKNVPAVYRDPEQFVLHREGAKETEILPPGITEPDLLAICVGPSLDSTTVMACLKELKEQCLYLHFDGVRYCFKKDPNVTLLVEQEADVVGRDEDLVRDKIKEMLEARLAGHNVHIWPATSGEVPDKQTEFIVGYLPLDFVAGTKAEQQKIAKGILEKYGDKPRSFRNGIGLAIPSSDQVEIPRRAVRYLLAIERVKSKSKQHNPRWPAGRPPCLGRASSASAFPARFSPPRPARSEYV